MGHRETTQEHLIVDGFMKGYTHWIVHGEDSSSGQMKELDSQDFRNSNSNQTIHNPNDSFTKTMGKNKDGQLRMHRLGVTTTNVYGEKPSRATLLRQTIKYKEKFLKAVEKYETLNAKLEDLLAYVHRTQFGGQPDAQSAPSASPSRQDGSENAPLTAPNGQASSAYVPFASPNGQVNAQSHLLSSPQNPHSFGSASMRIKVGSYVVLKSLANINEIVATGIVEEMATLD